MRSREHERILITGGAGFIGSALIRFLMQNTDVSVTNIDKLTYAGNLDSLHSVADNPRYFFKQMDICDAQAVAEILVEYQPGAIIHLAAESHVDRSIDGPADFVDTNIVGTYNLLENALAYWSRLTGNSKTRFVFHQVSTDEVYGSLGADGYFLESSPYQPTSPYSASKAAADHLVRSWHHTYGLPVVITNCSNNYGPCQFPEKLIPLTIINAIFGKSLPVYGRGDNVRDWLYVEDHARALWSVVNHGKTGETYNIGGNTERRNIDVVKAICAILDNLLPESSSCPHDSLITFVEDRPGHDKRYAIDCKKIERELGWMPTESFSTGLTKTVRWYLDNEQWWRGTLKHDNPQQRAGLRRAPASLENRQRGHQ